MSRNRRLFEQRAKLLGTYAREARPVLLEYMRKDGCIAAARVTLDVLNFFGLPAEPIVVEVVLINQALRALRERLGRMPSLQEQQTLDPTCWGVGVGQEDTEGPGWAGHLVTLVSPAPEYSVLLDPTLDQADRPHKQIIAPPVVLCAVGPEFLAGTHELAGEIQLGGKAAYHRRLTYEPYETSPDWYDPHRYDGCILRLIHLLEKAGHRAP